MVWPRCDGCLECTRVCPSKALRVVGEWLTVDAVVDVARRDARYYAASGGGITFSGGEPFAQPSFLQSCASRCKDLGIHVAVDTCGYAPWSIVEEILPYVDLFLFDIKVIDRKRHRELTGVDNDLILDNFRRIGERGKRVWVRVPLVPGCTDSEENISAIREHVRVLGHGEEISLLPYNPIAAAKYAAIGKTYPLEN
jgi:pyruvate formate lyase activating enzyme